MRAHCRQAPYSFVIEAGVGTQHGRITARSVLKERVPVPMGVLGVHVEALKDDGGAVPTLDFAFQVRPERDGAPLFYTRAASLVPAALVAGTTGEPFRWPAPRVWRKAEMIEIIVEPSSGVALERLVITFFGERLDYGPADHPLLRWDRKDAGYQALVLDAAEAVASGTTFQPGGEAREILPLPNFPFDVLVEEASVLLVDTSVNPNAPLAAVGADVKLYGSHNSQWLGSAHVPASFFGGQTQVAGVASTDLRPVSTALGAGLYLTAEGQVEAFCRHVYGATDPLGVRIALHGQRVPKGRAP